METSVAAEPTLQRLRLIHPETGRRLVVVASSHFFSDTNEAREMTDEIAQFAHYTNSRRVNAFTEGRAVSVLHNGILYPGDRNPAVDTSKKADAIAKHGDVGLFACLITEGGATVQTAENDKKIILDLAEAQFTKTDLMRYLLWRQVSQWFFSSLRDQMGLGEYLQQDVISRFHELLAEQWPDFNFSFSGILGEGHTRKIWNVFGQSLTKEHTLHIQRELFTTNPDPSTRLGRYATVAATFNECRGIYFAHLLLQSWLPPNSTDTIFKVGRAHLPGLANRVSSHGVTY